MIWDTAERLVNRSTLIENNEDAKKIMRAPSKHKSLHRLKSMDGQVRIKSIFICVFFRHLMSKV